MEGTRLNALGGWEGIICFLMNDMGFLLVAPFDPLVCGLAVGTRERSPASVSVSSGTLPMVCAGRGASASCPLWRSWCWERWPRSGCEGLEEVDAVEEVGLDGGEGGAVGFLDSGDIGAFECGVSKCIDESNGHL